MATFAVTQQQDRLPGSVSGLDKQTCSDPHQRRSPLAGVLSQLRSHDCERDMDQAGTAHPTAAAPRSQASGRQYRPESKSSHRATQSTFQRPLGSRPSSRLGRKVESSSHHPNLSGPRSISVCQIHSVSAHGLSIILTHP